MWMVNLSLPKIQQSFTYSSKNTSLEFSWWGIVTFRMLLGPQSPSITSTLSRRNFHGLKLITGSVSKWPYFQLEASCHISFTNISFEMEIYVDNPSGAAVDFFSCYNKQVTAGKTVGEAEWHTVPAGDSRGQRHYIFMLSICAIHTISHLTWLVFTRHAHIMLHVLSGLVRMDYNNL